MALCDDLIMVEEKRPAVQRPQRGWERVTAKNPERTEARTTFRIEAPSPSDEVLAKHDAALDETPDADDLSEEIVCF